MKTTTATRTIASNMSTNLNTVDQRTDEGTNAYQPDRRGQRRTFLDRRSRPRLIRENMVEPLDATMAMLEAGHPLVDAEGNRAVPYRMTKRVLDIVGVLAVLALVWPILLAVYVALTITTRGKAIYVQDRVGYCGRRFRMYKFRSMRLDADKIQSQVKNEKEGPIFKNRRDPRITRLGRFIRATSIDELPQLLNVLKGDMTLVGPRPMVIPEVARQANWQRRRLGVMPGLTCLWQVSGRSEVSFEDWMRMDLWYLSNQNVWTDVKLLAKTPLTVITCKGAY